MKILVLCEESQAVTKAFRAKGHEAFSCDLLPCSGGHPEWHIVGDAKEILKIGGWDLVISFQPCTDLAVSGARWFWHKRQTGDQEKSIRFFFEIWKASNCSENPVGIMTGGKYIKKWYPELFTEMKAAGFPFKASQVINPFQFGHTEQKKTCLFLKGLPPLIETNNVYEEMMKLPYRERAKVHSAAPGPERAKLRSKTYPGIAQAMAEQWG